MHINKIVFLSFLFFSNLSYSDNNNQQLLIKDPKKVETFLIKDINDVEKTISNAENKVLLLNFWATWCVPCKKVMKYLNQYHEEYASDNLKVLMINTDTPRSLGKVRGFIKSQDYSFNVGMDPNKVLSKKLNAMIMPTLILVDKGGIIKWRHQGYVAGEEIEIEKQIKQVLGKNVNENIN